MHTKVFELELSCDDCTQILTGLYLLGEPAKPLVAQLRSVFNLEPDVDSANKSVAAVLRDLADQVEN